jgi:hypothetical protein
MAKLGLQPFAEITKLPQGSITCCFSLAAVSMSSRNDPLDIC